MKKRRRRPSEPPRAQYSQAQPDGFLWDAHAFQGEIVFDLTFELLGQRFSRRAKTIYAHTPAWQFLDSMTGTLRMEGDSTMFSLEVEAEDGTEWVEFGEILHTDVMPYAVADRIMAAIDDQCRAVDAERRRASSDQCEAP